MSHLIKANVKITNKNHLLSALDRLHWQYSNAQGQVKFGETADIVLGTGAVGLQQQRDSSWQIVGDPYYDQSNLREYYGRTEKMIADLQTSYNIVEAKDRLQTMGYQCIENEEGTVKNNVVRMVFDNLE